MVHRERPPAEVHSVPTTAQSDPALFPRVLVAVDGSAPPAVLLRQARTLGGPNARLTIQGVLWRADIGASRIGDRRAEEAAVALDEATDAARQAGIDVAVAPEPASEPAEFYASGRAATTCWSRALPRVAGGRSLPADRFRVRSPPPSGPTLDRPAGERDAPVPAADPDRQRRNG